jgi:hypothetical protein
VGGDCPLRRSPVGRPQGKLIGGAKFLYWQPPTAEEVAAVGFALEDYASPDGNGGYYDIEAKAWRFSLWADNWPAIRLFSDFSTQWRAGPAGVIGLDYNVFLHELDRRGLSRDEYDDLFGSLRVIEQVALKELHPK